MADTGETNGAGAQAETTWAGFIALMKWGTIASAAVGALVVFLIAQ